MKTIFVVLSNPVENRTEDYNEWYSTVHLPEVLKIDGFLSAQRFQLAQAQVIDDQEYHYMALYEIDSENPQETLSNLANATWLNMSDAIDTTNMRISVFDAIDEVMVSVV